MTSEGHEQSGEAAYWRSQAEYWRAEAECRAAAQAELETQNAELRSRVGELEGQVAALGVKVATLTRLAFGKSSEKKAAAKAGTGGAGHRHGCADRGRDRAARTRPAARLGRSRPP